MSMRMMMLKRTASRTESMDDKPPPFQPHFSTDMRDGAIAFDDDEDRGRARGKRKTERGRDSMGSRIKGELLPVQPLPLLVDPAQMQRRRVRLQQRTGSRYRSRLAPCTVTRPGQTTRSMPSAWRSWEVAAAEGRTSAASMSRPMPASPSVVLLIPLPQTPTPFVSFCFARLWLSVLAFTHG